jgi:hypothetical protein
MIAPNVDEKAQMTAAKRATARAMVQGNNLLPRRLDQWQKSIK